VGAALAAIVARLLLKHRVPRFAGNDEKNSYDEYVIIFPFGFFPVTGRVRRRCPLTLIKKNHMSNKANFCRDKISLFNLCYNVKSPQIYY
jgi:hypothetical protein